VRTTPSTVGTIAVSSFPIGDTGVANAPLRVPHRSSAAVMTGATGPEGPLTFRASATIEGAGTLTAEAPLPLEFLAPMTGTGTLTAEAGSVLTPSPVAESVTPKKKRRVASSSARTRRKRSASARTKRDVITNPVEVIRHSQILIIALQEALDYDPVRGHNQQPPALWIDNPSYLTDVNSLVIELRRLNSLLEAKRPRKKEAKRAVIDLAGHLNRFLRSYATTLGTGAGVLTLGVIADLLRHAGLDPTALWSVVKLPH
jgi:hypothetical protein